ncbi:MAG TPA: M48 family metallopeptidase [Burkholderiales bacterium]|nr:M48 family metallopeptidase [Burkholderiales bacterium]
MHSARWLIALVIAAFGFISYCSTTAENPITGEKQHIRMTPEQEVSLGRQLAPQMAAQMGGLSKSPAAERVRRIGQRVVERSSAVKTPYKYDFYVLADQRTVNAFALPGGQIFITEALLGLLNSEDEVAAVLGHEVGHVLARHSAEQLAKQQLTQQIIGAVVIGSGSYDAAQLANLAGSLIHMKHGRNDELEADSLGLRLTREAGYDPRAMIAVMQVLEKASGGARQPEFASTHPSPANRIQRIREQLEKMQTQ